MFAGLFRALPFNPILNLSPNLMNPKFSCADFTFPLLPHEKILALLQLLEIPAVDLGVFEGRSHHFPSSIVGDPEGSAKRMKTMLDQYGLEASDVFLQTGEDPPVAAANDPDPSIRESNRAVFEAMVTYTRELGCKHITGLPGVLHEGVDPDQDWELAVEETSWRKTTAEAAGLVYGIEAHVGSILPDPETTLRFIAACPEITLTLDYGHFIYQGMSSESAHPLLKHASHFHARGGAPGQLQSTMKDNTIDYEAIVRGLAEADYTGYLCLEYVWIDWEGCNRTDNISETLLLKQELEGYLKNLS